MSVKIFDAKTSYESSHLEDENIMHLQHKDVFLSDILEDI
jgi:hypothetical protein